MKKTTRLGVGLLWLLAGSLAVGDAMVVERMKGLLERSKTYEFGQSRVLLTEIEDQIKSVYGSPEELKKAEAVLLAALESDSSPAMKDFICRQLSVIGTEQSVPVLARMLGDAKTAAPAQYALVRIPAPAADTALIEHLSSGDPSLRIGILSTLGMRKSAGAVTAIAPLLTDPDRETADAAISALGQIGTAEAARVIREHAAQIAEPLKPRMDDALLACGENLVKQGDSAKAAEIFKSLYTAEHSVFARSSALSGLVRTMGSGQSEAILLEALNDADPQIQTAAIRLACQLPSEKVLAEARGKMPQFSPVMQIRFLTALGEFKAPYAKETALASLASESAEVRLAACETLAAVGDGSCVLPLAAAAAEAADRTQREAAREALSRLPDPGADHAIAEGIEKADLADEKGAKIAAELIRAAGQRTIRDTMPAVIQAVSSENPAVVREAFQTLQIIAEPKDLPQLVTLLKTPNPEIEKTLVIVALKESEPKGRAGAILSYFKETQEPSLKASVYRVLGPIGDPDSLEVLRAALKDSNPALREAAFRGLAEWPGPDVIEDMKQFVKQGENETIRVIAFRAYVRMVRQSDLATEPKVSALAGAMSMAPRESENKAVLAALGEQPSEQALAIAVKNLDNTELKAEAQAAVLGICEKLAEKQPGMCRTALTKLLESSPNEAITNRAKEVLNTIK